MGPVTVTSAGRRPNALPICRISGWPRAVKAISSAGHLRGGAGSGCLHVPWEDSATTRSDLGPEDVRKAPF